MTFKQLFFRHYDKKVTTGILSFSKTGISKEMFTAICSQEGYLPTEDEARAIAIGLALSEDEERELIESLRL